jgi:hypothetical protein
MTPNSSRRRFLAAGLAVPAAASASRSEEQATSRSPIAPPAGPVFRYKTLGRTGLKVTTVGFGA